MANKPKDDFADFQEWLIIQKGMTPQTSSVYACKVRKTLRTLSSELSPALLDKVFTGAISSNKPTIHPDGSETSYTPLPLSKAQQNLFYSAWKHFTEYCSIKFPDSDPVPQPTPRSTQQSYDIPLDVWECVTVLKTTYRIPLVDMFTHYRCDMVVKRGRSSYELKDKRHASAIIPLRGDHIKPILEWATGEGKNPSSPFFPTVVGGEECIPVRTLHKLYRQHCKGQH